jgi:endonuclease/exonuclease/phosphatase family metal-dependent hydrolase
MTPFVRPSQPHATPLDLAAFTKIDFGQVVPCTDDDEEQQGDPFPFAVRDPQAPLASTILFRRRGPAAPAALIASGAAVRRNSSLAAASRLVAVTARAVEDRLSSRFNRSTPTPLLVLYARTAESQPVAFAERLSAHRADGVTLPPKVYEFPDRHRRPAELGLIQEVELVALRCRKQPETIVVRFFVTTHSRVRSLMSMVRKAMDPRDRPFAEQDVYSAATEFMDTLNCRNSAKSSTDKGATGADHAPRPVLQRPSHPVPATQPYGTGTMSHTRLRVMTYNIWNFNKDWFGRCDQIAKVIRAAAPDVLLVQEARIDIPAHVERWLPKAAADPATADIAGHAGVDTRRTYYRHSEAQVEHLTRHLGGKLPYWFDHLPAMVYQPAFDFSPIVGKPHVKAARVASEGPVIMHHFASLGVFPIFLPRTRDAMGVHEPGDDHQRLVLCHALAVPEPGSTNRVRVDVCTTHFSLSENAQRLNVEGTIDALRALARRPLDGLQAAHTVFGGDLNAEPDSDTIQTLLRAGFVDAYSHHSRNRFNAKPGNPCDKAAAVAAHQVLERDGDFDGLGLGAEGYTFNNVDEALVKRIDFILLKTWAAPDGKAVSQLSPTHLCVELVHHAGRAAFHDGVDPASGEAVTTTPPASDHVAVVADLVLLWP